MLKNFIKYQSLGNDFIIFDLFRKPNFYVQAVLDQPHFQNFIINLCNRNFGVGADCCLVLKTNQELNLPEIMVFNSDGSYGQVCLNGLRCVALFLSQNYKFPKKFNIKMDSRIFENSIEDQNTVTTQITKAKYLEQKIISIDNKKFTGHVIDIGNPHFVILEQTEINWLKQNGFKIENHKEFTNKTNVEFLWQENNSNIFNMLVYERGCGFTLACSSGTTAAIYALLNLKKIKINDKITIKMPGGQVTCWIDQENNIFLQAQSAFVFTGSL